MGARGEKRGCYLKAGDSEAFLGWTSWILSICEYRDREPMSRAAEILKVATQPLNPDVDLRDSEIPFAKPVPEKERLEWAKAVTPTQEWVKVNSVPRGQVDDGRLWFYFHFQGYKHSDYVPFSPSPYWKHPSALSTVAQDIYAEIDNNVKNTVFRHASLLRPICVTRSDEEGRQVRRATPGVAVIPLSAGMLSPECLQLIRPPVRTEDDAKALLLDLNYHKVKDDGNLPDFVARYMVQAYGNASRAYRSGEHSLEFRRLGAIARSLQRSLRTSWMPNEDSLCREAFDFCWSLGLWGWQFLYFFPAITYFPRDPETEGTHGSLAGGFSCSFPRALAPVEFNALNLFCQHIYNGLLAQYYANAQQQVVKSEELKARVAAVAGFGHQVAHVMGDKSNFPLYSFNQDELSDKLPPARRRARTAQIRYAALLPRALKDSLVDCGKLLVEWGQTNRKESFCSLRTMIDEVWEELAKPLLKYIKDTPGMENFGCAGKEIELLGLGEITQKHGGFRVPNLETLKAALFESLWNAFEHGSFEGENACVDISANKGRNQVVIEIANPYEGRVGEGEGLVLASTMIKNLADAGRRFQEDDERFLVSVCSVRSGTDASGRRWITTLILGGK